LPLGPSIQIYVADSIDEGIDILTGLEAGERREDGTYPEGGINDRVDEQLNKMAEKLKQFRGPAMEEKEN
jgi:hypothetical protein